MAKVYWIGGSSTDWSTAANWSGAAVPVDGDDVFIENNAVNIDAGLGQNAIQLNNLTIDQSYTGLIGTTSAYLVIGASGDVNIGQKNAAGKGSGSKRIKIDFRDDTPTSPKIIVHNTASSAQESLLPPVRLLTNHASATLTVLSGNVGLAVDNSAETSTVGDVIVGDGSDATVDVGPRS